MTFILRAGELATGQNLGGKAAALAALRGADVLIPDWFVVKPTAFEASLTTSQRQALASAALDGSTTGSPLDTLTLSAEVHAALIAALADLCPDGEALAVRSSALEEDGARTSFAGQFVSFLTVPPAQVADRVAAVWRSANAERVLAYRRTLGLASVPPAPAVLIQRMVHADFAGVAFSADPLSGRRSVVVVTAVAGLGDQLVDGACDAMSYRVDRQGRVARDTPDALARSADEARNSTTPAGASPGGGESLLLSDRQVAAVAALARTCERHFGRPQDIEWAIASGEFFLLQSRPITTLGALADPDGAVQLWDNSNIAESYNGITTPLTFSFALHVYEEVYRQLARALGAPAALLEAHADTFRHMLGLIRGRVYYNLASWYRLLALLPGFTVNRRFMEQMMGVKEGLPARYTTELTAASWRARLADGQRLATALCGLSVSLLTLPRRIRRFYARLDAVLGATAPDLGAMRADELVEYYRHLKRQLITHWDAPLLNDLFAMVFYGLLRTLAGRWCEDGASSLHHDLLSGQGGIISAEPAARVRDMAGLAAGDAPFVAALRAGSLSDIERDLRQRPAFASAYQAYLDKFADRCLEELKLESPTLLDDPLPMLRAVGHLADRLGEQATESAGSAAAGADARTVAERRVATALRWHPLRRMAFRAILAQARRRVRDRENLRFERTRVFGRVRRIFVELGRRLHALDLLDAPRDVFYLNVEEVLGFVEGTAACTDLNGLAALRRAEFARYGALPTPADRFETRGIVYQGNAFRDTDSLPDADGERCQGIGCCPGVVRGRVRIVTNPKEARVAHGEILIAERTDPGWIMLFPLAAGVVVERGSVLSHSAIVARELGIPTVVAAKGVTHWLADGDWVELDGSAGTVTRLAGIPTAERTTEEEPHVPR